MSVTVRSQDELAVAMRKTRSRLGVYSQSGARNNPEKAALARTELAALRIERAIAEAVEAAPPLAPERRAELAEMLRSGVQR